MRRHRRLRVAAAGLLLSGGLILGWVGAEALERRAAARRGRAELALAAARSAEADALASLEFPVLPHDPPAPRPAAGEVVARIVMPALGVDAVARAGVDRRTLRRGAGHFPGTALPGEPGNVAFAAHRDREFRPLERAAPGQDVYLDTGEATWVYRVVETRVVGPADLAVLDGRGGSDLTLVTCYPFDWVGPAPERFVVRAALRGRFDAGDRILDDVRARPAAAR